MNINISALQLQSDYDSNIEIHAHVMDFTRAVYGPNPTATDIEIVRGVMRAGATIGTYNVLKNLRTELRK
jgi:hypothetical protein